MKKIIISLILFFCVFSVESQVFAVDGHQFDFALNPSIPVQQIGAVIHGYYDITEPTYTPSTNLRYGYATNLVIENKSFTGLNVEAINLWECTNTIIRNCKFSKSAYKAIQVENCNGLLIENCIIDSMTNGIQVTSNTGNAFNNGTCSNVKILHNYIRNTIGGSTGFHAIQLSGVNGGGGNQVNWNTIENIHLQSHQDDMISLFNSSGLQGDSIQVIGNWIRGGDWNTANHTGGVITFGDNIGSYIHVKNNIIVNAVGGGIGNAGGRHTLVECNTIYQDSALCSPTAGAYTYIYVNFTTGTTAADVYDNTFRYNRGYAMNHSGVEQSYAALYDTEHNNTLWEATRQVETNIVDHTLTAAILPTKIRNVYHY